MFSVFTLLTFIDSSITSGNGNPAFLLLILLVPNFICSNILFAYYIKSVTIDLSLLIKLILFVVTALIFIVCFYLESRYIMHLISLLGGGPTNRSSRIYRFGWFNVYTNSIFFNLYTFILVACVSHVIGLVWGVICSKSIIK